MPTETLYEGPAHQATFHVPSAGVVRFGFSDPRATGYVRSPDGSLARVQPGGRLFLAAGQHVLTLYDPKLTRVSIMFVTPSLSLPSIPWAPDQGLVRLIPTLTPVFTHRQQPWRKSLSAPHRVPGHVVCCSRPRL